MDTTQAADLYGQQIRAHLHEYTVTGAPRQLESARLLMAAMAISRGLTAADVQAILATVTQVTLSLT